jgi:hypothetical protein
MYLKEAVPVIVSWCLQIFGLDLARLDLLPPLAEVVLRCLAGDKLESVEDLLEALKIPTVDPLEPRPEARIVLFLSVDIRKSSEYDSDLGVLRLKNASGRPLMICFGLCNLPEVIVGLADLLVGSDLRYCVIGHPSAFQLFLMRLEGQQILSQKDVGLPHSFIGDYLSMSVFKLVSDAPHHLEIFDRVLVAIKI